VNDGLQIICHTTFFNGLSDYDDQEFAIVMQKVISEPVEANRIAMESYKTGSLVFNYKTYTNSLINIFIKP
jgi:hypothetical protein